MLENIHNYGLKNFVDLINALTRLNMVYFTIFGPDFEQDDLWLFLENT